MDDHPQAAEMCAHGEGCLFDAALAEANPSSRPICECGHPPVAHGDPGFFGANTICLEPGCPCVRYQDTFEVGEDDKA